MADKIVLVTGSRGFIGRKIADAFKETPGVRLVEAPGHETVDLTDGDALKGFLSSVNPDIVINSAAVSVMSLCESDPKYAQRLNTGAVEIMAGWCARTGSRLIQISTDTVFGGQEKVFHKEEDAVSPPNVYGRTKAEAEKLIERLCSNYAIVRVVLVYGDPLPGQHGNFVRLVMDKLANGQTINAVNDQWRTPTYVLDVAKAVKQLSGINENGIWHVCGQECFSIYELALAVAEHCGLDKNLITPTSTQDQDCGFARPKYGLLDISKAQRTLGFVPTPLAEAIKQMKK